MGSSFQNGCGTYHLIRTSLSCGRLPYLPGCFWAADMWTACTQSIFASPQSSERPPNSFQWLLTFSATRTTLEVVDAFWSDFSTKISNNSHSEGSSPFSSGALPDGGALDFRRQADPSRRPRNPGSPAQARR